MQTTLADLSTRSEVKPYEHLDLDEIVPVLDTPQPQGDVMFLPCGPARTDLGNPVTAAGITLVAGQHSHVLIADADTTRWVAGAGPSRLSVGVIHTTEPCWIIHPEHGGLGLAPGAWEVRRQREQADEERLVAD